MDTDLELEELLAYHELNWCTGACVYEDIVDPAHIFELTSPASKGLEGHNVKVKEILYLMSGKSTTTAEQEMESE